MAKAVTKPGTSGPDAGDPGGARGNLIQRNNRTSISMADHGASGGEAVVAQWIARIEPIVLAQPNGASTSITLDDPRSKLAGVGVEDAVFLDGSIP